MDMPARGSSAFSNDNADMNQGDDVALLRVLHVEDAEPDHVLTLRALRTAGLQIEAVRVDTLDAFSAALDTSRFDVVLADYHLPGFTAMDAWQLAAPRLVDTPFILVSGAIGEATAVAAVKAGMADYVMKSDLGRLKPAIQAAIALSRSEAARRSAQTELESSQRQLAELAAHLQLVVEEERTRVARELHDDIGSALTAIKLDLASAKRQTSAQAMVGRIDGAFECVQRAIAACQRIAFDLRPPILDEGIRAALQWLVDDMRRRTAIEIKLSTSAPALDLPVAVELAAYRTVQEALHNAIKHAACRHIAIDFTIGGGAMTVDVRDDGKGLTHGAQAKPRSFGLRGLRERAAAVGGWLDISSRPGKGTAVTLVVPIDRQAVSNGAEPPA